MPFAKALPFIDAINRRRRYFSGNAFDQDTFDAIMSKPKPDNVYTIFFTPRSGSTRVTSLIGDAKLSNYPGEFFNEYFIHQMAQRHSARNVTEFVALIQRNRQRGGHFGFEITFKQLALAFFSANRFLNIVNPDHTAWLIREDIISQAVSGSRLIQTKVPHTPVADQKKLNEAEQKFTYDPKLIQQMVKRIMWMEQRTESLIRQANLETFRFSYEMTNTMGPERTTRLLASKLGLAEPSAAVVEHHKKLPGTKGRDFSSRFREEHPAFVASVNKKRARLLLQIEQQKEKYL